MAPAKERMKMSREKKKRDAEQWEVHLLKERERDKLRRLKKKEELKTDLKAAGINREKIRARVKLYRERKKMLTPSSPIRQRSEKNSPIGSYKCVQSFGKAVNKVKRILPESPQKKAAVLKKIVSEIIGPEGKKLFDIPQKKPNKAVSDDEKKIVVDFYCRDDVSRQAPGIKDFITVKINDGGKTKFQKRHMILSVGEAYQEFKNSFPDIKIGKSKFYTLRPPYVLLQTDMPHNVCVCKYHFNVIELTESLRRAIQSFPQSHTEVLNQVSCDIGNESCMYSLCSTCSKIDLKSLVNEDEKALLKKDISWKEWGEDENKRPLLKTVVGTCETALRKLELKLKHFKKHCFVKKTQSNYFNQVKSNLKDGQGVLQFDFAENYSVVTQDEIQSAHWSHSQITIFTCCLWLPKKEVQSFVVISDDRTHSKFSVWTFLKSVLSHIKSENVLNHVFIFSDNCAGQFKNRFILSNLCWFEQDFNVTAEWNFFSSSHGKGAMDGVGAVVKRTAWIAVKARKILISDAKDFYTFAKENVAGVTCLFISKEQIEENKPLLENRWETVKAIPGIQEGHHFRVYDKQDILIAKTSLSLMLRINVFQPSDFEQHIHARKRLSYSQVYSDSESECEHMVNEENCQPLSSIHTSKVEVTDVKSGLFVLIEVESDRKRKKNSKVCNNYTYVGICQSEVDEEDEVKVLFLKSMSKYSTTFRPSDEAVSFIKFSQIICKLPEPELKPQGNRLYYQFPGPVTLREKNI